MIALLTQASWAQTPAVAPDKPAPKVTELDTVTVVSDPGGDNRQEATAAKIVVTREELARYGDTSVTEVLKRLPGVTVTGNSARGVEIRMRGLGSGYTQVLLNGDPVSSGFSIESLPPDLIERIEVQRVPTADRSAQAVAGTINIVLKQTVRQAQKDVRLTASYENGRPSEAFNFQVADKWDKGSWGLGLDFRNDVLTRSSTVQRTQTNPTGLVTSQSITHSDGEFRFSALTLTPRLNIKRDAIDSFALDALITLSQSREHWPDRYETQVGATPFITAVDAHSTRDFLNLRARVNWTRKLEEGAQLDVKGGYARGDRDQLVEYDSLDAPGQLQRHRGVDGPATDVSWTLNGKYRAPLSGAHALSLGWDGERAIRTEDRIQRDVIPLNAFTPDNLDETFDARFSRLALFAQDEWDVGHGWSLYQGLRWEEIDTRVSGNGFSTVSNRASVLSPILQSVWKIPETKSDQLRLGLSRTYKAPSTIDLSPRRRIAAIVNSPGSADFEGNADLRPELAWGLDVAYEHYVHDKGLVSVSLFGRRIKDVILNELFQDDHGLWITRPANSGQAHVLGLEFELKGKLKDWSPEWSKDAPDVDLRFNAARNHSWVEAVPGPGNRLAQQTPASLNLGADWRPQGSAWTLGSTLGVVRYGWVRSINYQTAYTSVRRQLEAYALYKFDARSQIRVTGVNLLHQTQISINNHADAGGDFSQTWYGPTHPTLRVALELKL